jgi:hypothetical protein
MLVVAVAVLTAHSLQLVVLVGLVVVVLVQVLMLQVVQEVLILAVEQVVVVIQLQGQMAARVVQA